MQTLPNSVTEQPTSELPQKRMQQEINYQEWSNPQNWRFRILYSSKRDNRWIVPFNYAVWYPNAAKYQRPDGLSGRYTLNYGHPIGRIVCLTWFLIGLPLSIFLMILWIQHFH